MSVILNIASQGRINHGGLGARGPGPHIKVCITAVGILNICNLWILQRKIVVFLVGRKRHLHGRFR